jgi:hypothetical protein
MGNAVCGWGLTVAAVLVLGAATPSWSTDDSQAVAVTNPGATSAYELGISRLDPSGLVDMRSSSLAVGQVGQAAGASGTEAMDPARDPAKAEHPEGLSNTDLNRALSNPVTSLWSLTSQFNNYRLANGRWNANWQFQPVLPVSLTKDWNLITRPVFQLYNIVPHETSPSG